MRGFKYILFVLALIVSAGAWGQYNPSNPAEPGAPVTYYTLTLQADPSGGGSFNLNATSSHAEGETFWVQANKATNFTFVEWTMDGETVSTNYRYQFTMPAKNVTLIAHYSYTPNSPVEPSEPDIPAKPVYANLWLTAQPTGGGTFNIANGTSYEVGTSVQLKVTKAQNFTFVNWTQDGEEISTSTTFNYIIKEGANANHLVANFVYTPGSPGEPNEPEPKKVYHRVYLMADPVGAGYFNTESGNQFEEGSQQTFRAYNNQNFMFENWTRNGEVVSTSSNYTMTIPSEDVTLTAHYSYSPGNPGEPAPTPTKHLSVYGMTANGVRSQTVLYPVFLENSEDVYSLTVVVRFPDGFTANTAAAMLAERTAGHQLSVTDLGDNAFRFDLTGDQLITGQNGKIFDVPVTIPVDCEPDQSYQVVVSNAARVNADGSKEVMASRNGYIFVEDVKEDGLYAQFVYEKLQGRVQFTNLSADKAISYHWDFGDGTTSTERNPMHIYAASGQYVVTLTVRGQTGSDVAQNIVLINDESTWVVDGVFFLDTEVRGVRYFTSANDLITFMAAHPITGSLKVNVKAGEIFGLDLTEDMIAALTAIQQQMADGGYTLTITANGEVAAPTLNFGTNGSAIDSDVVSLFVALGRSMVCDDVQLKLWGITFNPSKLPAIEAGQSVLSGSATEAVDFSPVSQDLVFTWTATADVETAEGYETSGTGNIPSMTVTSGSADDAHLIYNIEATYGGNPFVSFTHPITLKPALEGSFTELTPEDGARLETTTVTLTWNSITNAVYDVYLWNAANQRPDTPVAEGITALSYTSQNFCQNMKSYKWQVVARNAQQQLPSDTMHFSIQMLPDLHVCAIQTSVQGDLQSPLEGGRKATIQWTVRNDGDGATGQQAWHDRVWLVPDVYGGTIQDNCTLLATVPNVKSLASGEEYVNSAEVTIDDKAYGNYFLLVAADMSSVSKIEWSSIGGAIVTPYQPGNTYPYLFATTEAVGNQLEEHGETVQGDSQSTVRSDNFFYQKVEIAMATMDDDDWNILQQAYQQMGSGEGWTKAWNFDVERHTVQTLPGVTIHQGHVSAIDLSDNNLTGSFPYTLLTLPQIGSLNLSGNNLTGDLAVQAANLQSLIIDGQSSLPLTSLNISHNQLSGNIGAFAAQLPLLVTLNAHNNSFAEVSPMISTTVKTLTLNDQRLTEALDVDLTNMTGETLMAQVPSVLLYNHKQQNYANSLTVTATADDGWQATVNMGATGITFTKKGVTNVFRGQNDGVLQIASENGDAKGTTLGMKLSFAQGDANFNGTADVVDLQAQINFAFEDYNDKPFNFTAANLWVDDVINVQDVVKMTDLLLTINDAPAGSRESDGEHGFNKADMPNKTPQSSQATLYIKDGQLWIETDTPVAAFELTLDNVQASNFNVQLEVQGFTCRSNSKDGFVRMVGYSMSGATLPTGFTPICTNLSGDAVIVDAVLSDANAEEIPARLANGGTTAVEEIRNSEFGIQNSVYDLQGRRVSESVIRNSEFKKGMYIVNGKKVVK